MKQMKKTQVIIGVLLVSVTSHQGARAQPSFGGFAPPILIETGKSPVHVIAIDIDGIFGIDLVVANRGVVNDSNSPPSIQTFLSNGIGGFNPGPVFDDFFVTEPRHMVTGSSIFQGSQDILVVADGRGDRIVSFRIDNGIFLDFVGQFNVGRTVMSVALGQRADGPASDLLTDAYTANLEVIGGDPLGVLSGGGGGFFSSDPVLFDVGGVDLTVFVAVIDNESNQFIDHVVTLQTAGGKGSPAGSVTLSRFDQITGDIVSSFLFRSDTGNIPRSPAVCRIYDLNNDTMPDLIFTANGIPNTSPPADFPTPGIFIAYDFINMHNGVASNSWFPDNQFVGTEPRPFDIVIADIDMDGKKDFVVTHQRILNNTNDNEVGSIDISVFLDTGPIPNTYVESYQFTFDELGPSTNPDLSVSPQYLDVVDIDGDGDLDIVTTRTQNNKFSTNQPNGHIALFRNLTILNADLNGDGVVNATDLAILLGNWGPCTCFSDINGDGNVNAADNAILLGNWTGGNPAMAQPGGMTLGDTTLFQDDSGATQPSQNITTTTVPWVIAHFGFDSVASYTGWLELLTEDELFNHIAAMLDLIIVP